jgi:LPS-assembly protein
LLSNVLTPSRRPVPRRHALAAAVIALCGAPAAHAQAADAASPLTPSPTLRTSRADESRLPVILQADKLSGRPDLDLVGEGSVELRRGASVIRADRLTYDVPQDLARATGNVVIEREGNRFSGPELQLHTQRFEGYFVQPDYYIARTQAGGHAQRVNFLDPQRAEAIEATYTSCPRDGSQDPAWLLSTDRVRMDFATNTGIAEGAVVRFLGVPILAAPVLSFPLTDDRKSGWLPPSINLDSRSGFVLGVPYYWNIAPNRDATFTPVLMTRRGAALESEFRYLQPSFEGRVNWNVLPNDRVSGRYRDALQFVHEGDAPGKVHYRADLLRVSDDAYWKDFPRAVPSITPRLLPLDLGAERRFDALLGDWRAYARVQRWQVLNDADPANAQIAPPYERLPQVGLRGDGRLGRSGLRYNMETEVDRFELAEGIGASSSRPTNGTRAHLLAGLSWPFELPGGWITPKVQVNAASYRWTFDDSSGAEQRSSRSRVVPTVSVDSGLVFERDTRWLGQQMRQTLEPRLMYVNTPFRAQSDLPNFDAAGKDFNDISIYSENSFSGVDRVSDTHALTAGLFTRWLDAGTGVEAMRLGLVQRYLFRTQQVTPSSEGGTQVEGEPVSRRLSDLLLLGSSNIWKHWTRSAAVQYNAEISRTVRSILGVRYSPGPFRTINVNYRLTRGSSEQAEVGWQWPIYGPALRKGAFSGGQGGGSCEGSWYTVGRVNYSLRDRRVTDALAGFEYDAGCWIGRVVAERVSTGRTEAATRLMLQLELVGLSRLGSNPLKALKDNIPGYRLLREERGDAGILPSP